MKKVTLIDQLRYKFDNFMSKGTVSLIGGLALVSALFICVMALVVAITGITPEGGDRLNFIEAFWASLMRTLDSGTMGGDAGWSFRIAMLIVTLGGIFVISTLIGLLGSGIESKLEELRKGRSRVIETNHTVILGWSLQVFTLISELVLANANQSDSCIVILSEQDKVEMEETINQWVGKTPKTRIVCRTGSPSNMADLGMVSIQTARSVVVLSNNSDSELIKTLLAIVNIPRPDQKLYHVVVQASKRKSLEIINLIGGNQVEILLTNELIARLIAQTCRQPGLSTIYMDLLSFVGNEIYLKDEPSLVSKTYGDILFAYEQAAVIGLKHQNGSVQINPAMHTLLQSTDQIILISEDDNTARLSGIAKPPINQQLIKSITQAPKVAEKTLILGWNKQVPLIIQELDSYVAVESLVTLVAHHSEEELEISEHSSKLVNQTLAYQQGDPTERRVLDSLNVPQYDHVIVLCSDEQEPEQADSQTLVTLLQLRDIANQSQTNFPVVTEMLDLRNQVLAQVAKPDDFVISEQIISRMIAQVAEQKVLNTIYADLFSAEGSEIYLKSASEYVAVGQPVNFYTVLEAAKQRSESAIGYRIKAEAHNVAKSYGVVLNPNKSEPINFSPDDQVIVLASE